MPKNQQNHSNSDVDNIKEGISKMVITKEEFDESIEYPYRPGEPDCRFYLLNGRCNYGTKCHFNHPPPFSQSSQYKSEQLPQREGRPDCGFFVRTGSCNFGSCCKYHHPLERRPAKVSLNSLGLPLRKEENCKHFMKYLRCNFGAACKFNHPEPTSAKTALPALPEVSGSTTAVGTGAYLPSPVMPYVASSPALPWTSSSYFPGQPSYMPYIIPAVQGVVAIPNWNGYLGSSSVMGTGLAYTSKNPSEVVTVGQADWSTMANLPQRPDQPEPEVCRFFMSSEGCKYGSKCKYYHPREKIAYSLGPHGFPLRPAENTCAHFSSYGICRNGPSREYNHPIAGYISGYYLGMPFVQGVNQQPYVASLRNMTTETSRSIPVKITDWIQEPETRHGCVPKHVENSPEDDQIQPNAATGEIPKDQTH